MKAYHVVQISSSSLCAMEYQKISEEINGLIYLFGLLKSKDFNEWSATCFCPGFWFLRAPANLSNAFDETVCIWFNFYLFSCHPEGAECLSDSPWQISYGRSAVIENSPPKGSPAGKAHEQMLSLATMHCWRHAVRKYVRHCFGV